MLPNQDQIERDYLKLESTEEMENSDETVKKPGHSNYLPNRSSISKFLKDEAAHYQEQFDSFCKELSI